MSKIKDQLELNKEWSDKELESIEPRYEYIDENKKHLHTYNKKPLLGTSTVVGVIAKPLTWWASGLACEKFGWINKGNAQKGWTSKEERLLSAERVKADIELMDTETYLTLLDDAYKAHSVKLDTSATAGTDMHAELEKYVKLMISDQAGQPMLMNGYENNAVEQFAIWSIENVAEFLYSEANCYSERLWVGGISDVGARLKDGRYVIIDFKSSKEAYTSQFIQCAGYAIQLEENNILDSTGYVQRIVDWKFDGVIIFPFGADKVEPQAKWNMEELKQGFESAVTLYKLTNN